MRYSTDESIFTLLPSVIVVPCDEIDVQVCVSIAQFFNVPITARGGGTGVAGQSIGSGMVLDFHPHFHRTLEIFKESAVVEPGVILQDLNRELGKQGKRFAPDPGSRASCTLGGMVATNAAGPHSYCHGSTRDHVKRMRVVLADGAILDTSSLEKRFPNLATAVCLQKEMIVKTQPKTRKNSSGHPLSELCQERPNYTKFLVGSEGTLALVTEIEVKIIPLPTFTTLAIYPFRSMKEALDFLSEISQTNPSAIELLDHFVLQALARANGALASAVHLDEANASLWVEWENHGPKEFGKKKVHVIEDPVGQSHLWTLRSKASKFLHDQASKKQPLRCVEDGVVPLEKISIYVAGLREILKKHRCDGAIFGHAGDGHFHVNPNIDVEAPHLPRRIGELMEEVYTFILDLGGSISGEHGDGILRRKFVERQWENVMPLFRLVKETFDPEGILNPGKKLGDDRSLMPPLRNFLELPKPHPLREIARDPRIDFEG